MNTHNTVKGRRSSEKTVATVGHTLEDVYNLFRTHPPATKQLCGGGGGESLMKDLKR
jgi:hypothetical protein